MTRSWYTRIWYGVNCMYQLVFQVEGKTAHYYTSESFSFLFFFSCFVLFVTSLTYV